MFRERDEGFSVMVSLERARLILVGKTSFTVTEQVFVALPQLAVIVAVPLLLPVTTPLDETVATLVLLDSQLVLEEAFCTVAAYVFE